MRSKGCSLDMFCSTKRRVFVAIVVWDVVVGRCGKIGGTDMTLEVDLPSMLLAFWHVQILVVE